MVCCRMPFGTHFLKNRQRLITLSVELIEIHLLLLPMPLFVHSAQALSVVLSDALILVSFVYHGLHF